MLVSDKGHAIVPAYQTVRSGALQERFVKKLHGLQVIGFFI